jgi:hypothetical protein
MGVLASRVEQKNMEQARIILRRMMWNLNDESGGIGWGSPEAMGEVLSLSPKLAMEFKSILFSYLEPGGNFIEYEMLQRGVIWGIGTYLKSNPDDLDVITKKLLLEHLKSIDLIKKAYALRALGNTSFISSDTLSRLSIDNRHKIKIFNGWNFKKKTVSDIIDDMAQMNHE